MGNRWDKRIPWETMLSIETGPGFVLNKQQRILNLEVYKNKKLIGIETELKKRPNLVDKNSFKEQQKN